VARPSIAIVVAFFGRAPLWLPAFFLSCRENPDVRWLLYTDIDVAVDIPPNVALKHLEIRDFTQKSSEALGTKVEIHRSLQKICDLKPAYGVIFADDLQPFDFWACSDLDIIWGDIRHFVTDRLLQEYDIVSSRADRLSGHFTLFRNTVQINRTYELIPNLAEALAYPRYSHLDERELTRHLRERLDTTPPPSWLRVYWREDWTTSAAYQKALGDSDADSLWWRNGRTFGAEGTELMYLHFHKLKQHMTTINFGFSDTPTAFTINRKGFSAGSS
jgi:hypothetical protein